MFEDFIKKLRKGIGADQDTDIPSFPTYEEVKPMNAERYEEIKKPTPTSVVDSGNHDGNIELKVVRPTDFAEVSDIADHLIRGCTVVLNTEELEIKVTMRMLDFLNGVTYTTDGDIKCVANNTYIITPNDVDVSDEG